MISNLRFELSFKNISQLENQLNFESSNLQVKNVEEKTTKLNSINPKKQYLSVINKNKIFFLILNSINKLF